MGESGSYLSCRAPVYVAVEGLVYASDLEKTSYMAADDDTCRDPQGTLPLYGLALDCGPAVVKGRVCYWQTARGGLEGGSRPERGVWILARGRSGLDLITRASRFTSASIAGLAVGAMGIFIFGLYLRRWLRERTALASEPQQDMIA